MNLPVISGTCSCPQPSTAVLAGVRAGPVDRAGRVLALGDAVLICGSAHADRVAEVVGWGGRRGVELVVHGPVPVFLALPTMLVELVETMLLDPVLPRRLRRTKSASADDRWHPADAAAGEPQPNGPGAGGMGGGLAACRHDQHPRTRSLSRPDGRR